MELSMLDDLLYDAVLFECYKTKASAFPGHSVFRTFQVLNL